MVFLLMILIILFLFEFDLVLGLFGDKLKNVLYVKGFCFVSNCGLNGIFLNLFDWIGMLMFFCKNILFFKELLVSFEFILLIEVDWGGIILVCLFNCLNKFKKILFNLWLFVK